MVSGFEAVTFDDFLTLRYSVGGEEDIIYPVLRSLKQQAVDVDEQEFLNRYFELDRRYRERLKEMLRESTLDEIVFSTLAVCGYKREGLRGIVRRAVNFGMGTCCNSGDFESWISLWADDGVQMPPGAPARIGKEQIREAMKPAFDQMNLDIAIKSIDDVRVYGNLGLTHCTYTLKMTPKAGGETISSMPDGKALTLFERQSDGSWKIVYDCFNSNL